MTSFISPFDFKLTDFIFYDTLYVLALVDENNRAKRGIDKV